MVEVERGCGWRKIGGFYLVGTGMSMSCDALPLDLDPCGECGYQVPFSRTMQMIHRGYLVRKIDKKHDKGCEDTFPCPICNLTFGDYFALMEVSKKAYSPQSFVKEASQYGVSKRVRPDILPKKFVLGETWVMLSHKEAILQEVPEQGHKRGIFYAFKPERIEAVVADNETKDNIKKLEEKGYTVVKVSHKSSRYQQNRKEKATE